MYWSTWHQDWKLQVIVWFCEMSINLLPVFIMPCSILYSSTISMHAYPGCRPINLLSVFHCQNGSNAHLQHDGRVHAHLHATTFAQHMGQLTRQSATQNNCVLNCSEVTHSHTSDVKEIIVLLYYECGEWSQQSLLANTSISSSNSHQSWEGERTSKVLNAVDISKKNWVYETKKKGSSSSQKAKKKAHWSGSQTRSTSPVPQTTESW